MRAAASITAGPVWQMAGVIAALGISLAARASGAAEPAWGQAEAPRPPGRPVVPAVRRPADAEAPVRACSFALPVCVHAAAGVDPRAILGALEDAERAMRAYDAMGLPRPLPDGGLGGGPELDLYLTQGARPLAPEVGDDMRAIGEPVDRASAFARIAAGGWPGCARASDAAYAVGYAIAARLDAGAGEGALAAAASYLATIAAPCAAAEMAAIDAYQRAPERAIWGGALGGLDGALLFPWFLDDAYGVGRPAGVFLSLLAIGAQRTPPDALRFRDEPDELDALRDSLRARGGKLDDLLLDYAVARAFVGSRSDGAHLADAARLGDFGRVRFEWSLPWGTLPRRVAPLRPIEPTGCTYLWLDLASAGDADEVTFVADWELPAVFRWALVKVDRGGAEVGRVDVAGIFGATRAQRTVVGLGGLAGLLIVGVHAGSLDRSSPLDPDDAPAMPHAYTVWLTR
ncbi:MAG: hypothetical protein IT372_02615 [Polyangiaceae bacterium]|nr:hypothetical protein [Polyangiaceae bacterium]